MLELICIGLIVYYESRGEPWQGQLAVASVVLNRIESPLWPDTACGVMMQKNQFEFYPPSYPIKDKKAWNRSLAAASYVLDSGPLTKARYFAQPGYLNGFGTSRIGNHEFYEGAVFTTAQSKSQKLPTNR